MAVAQSYTAKDSLISSKIADLKVFWNKYVPYAEETSPQEPLSSIPPLYRIGTKDTVSYADYQQKLAAAKIERQKKDLGLEFNANYTENLDPGFSDENLAYKRRIQTGLDWNILSGGFVESRHRKQVLENERIIQGLTPSQELNGNDFITISHKIIYIFNQQKIEVLKKRQEILSDKMNIANELYLLKHLSRLDLLQIMQQQVDVNSMYRVYGDYNQQLGMLIRADQLPVNKLPVVDVDMNKAFSYNEGPLNDSILKLKIANLELENKLLDDVKLNAQFRYNYYDLINPNVADRSFLSAGIGLSVPLPMGVKADRKVMEAQAALWTMQNKEQTQTKEKDLLNTFYEYRYKLKQYSNFYEKQKKYEELIRIERVKEKFGDFEFNPMTALDLLDELLTVKVELLDIQQQMYLQLLDLHSKLPGLDLSSIIKPYQMDTTAIQPEKLSRSMYIWSSSLQKYDDNYILEYLKLNRISNAILALNKETNKERYAQLVAGLQKKGISVEMLIGNNQLLKDLKPELYLDSLLKGIPSSVATTLHLDVEPQAMEDWQSNKEKYLKQYVDLLHKAHTYCSAHQLKLAVSIPVFFPEEVLNEIYANVDKVYLMAYEHNDAEYIVKKVKEELAVGAPKTIIAFRAKDFKDRTACEALISDLAEVLKLDRIALHDLGSFVQLDEQSVNKEH